MRKTVTAAVAFVFMVCLACNAFAGEEYTVKGEVVSIDSAGKTVVIKTDEGEKTVVFQETTKGFTNVTPGASVEMTCIDLEGKACAKDVSVISATGAGMPTKTFQGEIVSIDPGGKTIVIKTEKGEKMTIEMAEPTVEEVMAEKEAKMVEESLGCEPMPINLLKPGQMVRLDCFDSGEKFCANKITVISPAEAGMPVPGATEVVGEIVSLDPANKSVVIKTVTEEKTLYYQKVTAGMPFESLKGGTKVKAYCLDVEGKSCIKDITAVE